MIWRWKEANLLEWKLLNPLLVVVHGSSLWALKSKDAERIYKTWNLTVRNVFCLPRTIYRRLIEPVSSCFHIKISLISRYIKFVNTLMESRKFSVRYLARIMAGNVNSSMGSLLTFIGGELNLAINQINEVSPKVIKGYYICWFWTRRGVENISLHELVQVRSSAFQCLHIPGFDGDEINDMLNWICIS